MTNRKQKKIDKKSGKSRSICQEPEQICMGEK